MTAADKLRALIRYARPALTPDQVEALARPLYSEWIWLDITPDSAYATPAGCSRLVDSVQALLP